MNDREIRNHINNYLESEKTIEANRIYTCYLYQYFDELIKLIIRQFNFRSDKYDQKDLISECHLHVFQLMKKSKNTDQYYDQKNENALSYIYISIKNKLIRLCSEKSDVRCISHDNFEIEDKQKKEFNYEKFCRQFIKYLKDHRNQIYKKNSKRVILQTYINKFENQVYEPVNINDLNENLKKELSTHSHSSIKSVKYKLNYLYRKLKQEFIKKQELPEFKKYG